MPASYLFRKWIWTAWQTTADLGEADVILVNTCGFIESAKAESIEAILGACAEKQDRDVKVIVTGCLAERYKEELAESIPEVDAVVGMGSNADLVAIVERAVAGSAQQQCYGPKSDLPLGGSRRGAARAYLNILIVFLVSGFWHGAGWTFILWGGLHGLAQILERFWGAGREYLPKPLRWAVTFLFVNLAWVFFRAPDLGTAGALLADAVSGGWNLPLDALAAGVLDGEVNALQTLLPVLSDAMSALTVAALLAAGMLVALWPQTVLQKMETFRPRLIHAVAWGVLLVWAVLSFSSVATFIYSNF